MLFVLCSNCLGKLISHLSHDFFQLMFLDSRTYVFVAGRGTSVFSPLPLHLYLYVYVFVMCMRIHVTMLIGVIFLGLS